MRRSSVHNNWPRRQNIRKSNQSTFSRHSSSNVLRQLATRLQERKVSISLTDATKALLVDEGYDPIYGARPLKRTIQRLVLNPLAMRMLEGKFSEGVRIVVDVNAGELTFDKDQPVNTVS